MATDPETLTKMQTEALIRFACGNNINGTYYACEQKRPDGTPCPDSALQDTTRLQRALHTANLKVGTITQDGRYNAGLVEHYDRLWPLVEKLRKQMSMFLLRIGKRGEEDFGTELAELETWHEELAALKSMKRDSDQRKEMADAAHRAV